ncbi:MAG TPA: hypothetical protein VF256_05185, partial [Streptosporangiaceae bacterium]
MTSPLPRSRLAAETAGTSANNQSPCVPQRSVNDWRKDGRSWNEHLFHDLAARDLRFSRSAWVRRQGLEPRTRGLRAG